MKIVEKLNDIKPVPTLHGTGLKQIFLSDSDTGTKVVQFAYGVFKPVEECKEHI